MRKAILLDQLNAFGINAIDSVFANEIINKRLLDRLAKSVPKWYRVNKRYNCCELFPLQIKYVRRTVSATQPNEHPQLMAIQKGTIYSGSIFN